VAELAVRMVAARYFAPDRVVMDWLEVVLLASRGEHGGDRFRFSILQARWRCSQPTAFRRLDRINQAPAAAGLGRVEPLRGPGCRGLWHLILPGNAPRGAEP